VLRAVVWKEVREQGLIALTLLVLGAGILAAAATFADPPSGSASPADVLRYLGAGPLATLLLAVTAGTVCGGALFAAEREAGTIGFLESLPASRRELWAAKMGAGFGLAAFQIAVVLGVSAALGVIHTTREATAFGLQALLAFAWGAFGSTVARTTLGAVGVAIPTAMLAAIAFLLPVLLFFQNPGTNIPTGTGVVLFLGLMYATPVAMSAMAYTRSDRDRLTRTAPPPRPAHRAGVVPPVDQSYGHGRLGLAGLAWLATRQMAIPGLVLTAFALGAGLTLLLPTLHPLLAWLPVALAAGVLAGVLTFSDEQAGGSARYWGERRLPVGRMWAFKVGAHALLAGWLLVVAALPSVVRSQVGEVGKGPVHGQTFLSGVFRSLLFDELGTQGWKLVFLPAAYGFAAGHLCGLLFRKVVVGAGVATLIGGTLAALWVPSLLTGGVQHWQVWVPPVALLLTGRLIVRAWASDRLAAHSPVGRLAGGAVVTLLLLAAGIGDRVVEVPDAPDAEADVRFVDSLPAVDMISGRMNPGREFRTAASNFEKLANRVATDLDQKAHHALRDRADDLDGVLRFGWPPPMGNPAADLGPWLDGVFDPSVRGDEQWVETAEKAAAPDLPLGIYEHPRLIGTSFDPARLVNARRMGIALVIRGIQQQAGGDHADFPRRLRVALPLAANVRNNSVYRAWQEGNAIDRAALLGTDHWLRRLPAGHPALLRAALDAVRASDTTAPFDPRPHLLAERYVLRERQKAPSGWLPDRLTPPAGNREASNPEVDLVAFAWTVPWERERTRRLLGLGFEAGFEPDARREVYGLIRGRPGAADMRPKPDMVEPDRALRVLRRAVILKLAVRLFQDTHESRDVPGSLTDLLTAGILPSLPADPYDPAGGTFRYRVTRGPVRQAVVESASAGDGNRRPIQVGPRRSPNDPTFVVPLPAPK
jgi:hypothetical protein